LIGKSILVGLIYLDADGATDHREQHYGIITAVEPARSVTINVDQSGEVLALPADPMAYEPAPPGDYQLYDGDRVIADPDFLTRWRVVPAPDGTTRYERRERTRLRRVEE
jgi:hypothetical protein